MKVIIERAEACFDLWDQAAIPKPVPKRLEEAKVLALISIAKSLEDLTESSISPTIFPERKDR